MQRIKAIISYDGTNFAGYQVQPQQRTVQLEIEKVLAKMHKGEPVKIVASGRTDAKVHATGQVIHFDTPLMLTTESWQRALNVQLPGDIRVEMVAYAEPDFHARYGAKRKTYHYIWQCGAIASPFRRNYTSFTKGVRPNIDLMHEAADAIIGTHDFSAFCAANTSVQDKVRTVYRLEIGWHGDELHLLIEGNGFLYNMVRIIAGTLWDVGMQKIKPGDVAKIIASGDRKNAGKTALPQGLYLESVDYL